MEEPSSKTSSTVSRGKLGSASESHAPVSTDTDKDDEGYLTNPADWTSEVAISFAEEEKIVLSGFHWEIIYFVRKYYDEHRVIPDVRHVTGHLVAEHGMDKKAAKKLLFDLFPYGYAKQACKIAGMRKPRAWSTG